MADRYELAFVKNAVSATGANPQEQTALENLLFQRLLTAGFTVSSGGVLGLSGVTDGMLLIGKTSDASLNLATLTAGTGVTITNAAGAITIAASAAGTVTHSAGALTANAIVVGNAAADIDVLPSLGTTTTVLHGNAAGRPTFGAIVNADIANTTIDLTAKVTGTLPVANGGTGVATATAHGVMLGNAASAQTVTAAGAIGTALTGMGASADPTFQPLTNSTCQGRLTLTTAVPVTTADVTGATTIYFTPYGGNCIALYDGANGWKTITFSETSLALGTLTSGLPYDVFGFLNGSTLNTELLAWTNGTTRATALTLQDGVLSKTGALTRRYLGTFYTTSTTQTEDSAAKRFVWNYAQRVPRALYRVESTASWGYNTTTIRQANGSTANQVAVIVGFAEDALHVAVVGMQQYSAGNAAAGNTGIGVDSVTAFSTAQLQMATMYSTVLGGSTEYYSTYASYEGIPSVGFHYYAMLEVAAGATTTFYGTQNGGGIPNTPGMSGWWRA